MCKIILRHLFYASDFLKKKLEDFVTALPVKTKILRRQNQTGIIASRLMAIHQAKGQVLTFLSSHCECADGWLEPLLSRIAAKRFAFVWNHKCVILFYILHRYLFLLNLCELIGTLSFLLSLIAYRVIHLNIVLYTINIGVHLIGT